ncbi:MAG: NCS2 family permease [Armatimonadia bacterium]|nr:NCS2 family permease [Armatimonadia bacterium]
MSAAIARFFRFEERRTSARTEIRAGITTFLTMAYILFVNPIILSLGTPDGPGVPPAAAAAGTALAAGLVCILMGLVSNFPLALASGMGLNAFLAFTVIAGQGVPWQTAMGLVVLDGAIVLVLVLVGVRGWVFRAIPMDLKRAIAGGLGLFLATLGLVGARIITIPKASAQLVADAPDPLRIVPVPPPVQAGPVHTWGVLLVVVGLVTMTVLHHRRIRGAILIGIVAVTALDIARDLILGDLSSPLRSLELGMPDLSAVGRADVLGALDLKLLPLLLGFIVVDFFDTLGTMTAIGEQARLTDEEGRVEGGTRILAVDALGAVIGGFCGASSVTSYVESASGVGEGGRTGLMPVVTGLLFLLSIILAPLFGLVPPEATAPALIFVGFLMLRGLKSMEWTDVTIAIPAFITLVTMPLTYSISHGIGYGVISYVVIGVLAGNARKIHPMMYVIAALFAASFIFVLE